MSMNVQQILENVIIYCIIEIQIFMTFPLNCSNRIWGFIFDGVTNTYTMFVFKILNGTAMHKNSSETIKLCCMLRNPCWRNCLNACVQSSVNGLVCHIYWAEHCFLLKLFCIFHHLFAARIGYLNLKLLIWKVAAFKSWGDFH